MPSELTELHKDSGFDRKKRAQLANNAERLIAKHRGKEAVKVPTEAYRKGYDNIKWGNDDVSEISL